MNSGSALIARITKPVDFLAQKARREKIYRALWNRAVLNPIKTLVRPLTAGLLFGLALGVIAAPQGGNVTAGSGTISTPDARTTVVKQNSNNLVVHWNSFNLAQDETVRFRQPSVQSQALNRIFDQNPSQIHGRINANGRVLLVNPSGIFFSPTARVNVGALIASGLPISEQDFMRGKYNFSPATTGEGGVIINRGLLQAATGGSINLIGGAVSNEGMILAEAGQVNLGAGRRAAIDFDGDGLLRFSVDEEILANAHNLDAAVSNSGEIRAEGGSVLLTAKAAQDVFSQVVNNSGVISAGRIEKQDGEIKLIAGGAGSSVLNTGTLDTSSGHSNGGRIGIEAGGSITLAEDASDGTGVENSDPAPSGQDEIVLQTPAAGEPADQGSLLLGSEIEISADSVNLGGEVNVDGASGGTIGVEAGDQIVLNGTLSGLGETGQGGQVELIGMGIDINRQAHIDVSGLLGGGTIQVGGSERGGDLRGRRAKELTVEEGARFDADALERGDGGRVIFWSDATRFAGHIQALGGPLGGDGGFAEVSGHHLWMTGHADLRAPQGDWGELLLDPGTVTICDADAMGCADDPAGAPADTFTDTYINTQLMTADVSIDTAAANAGPLDINLRDTVDLNWTTASILTLTAGNDINLAGSITAMGGTLGLNFVNQLDFAGASVDVGTVMATGGGAASILQGPATGANIWTVTGATDAGTLVFGGQTVSFSSVGNLNGGAGADTFTLNLDAALSGNIEGGAGDNTYNLIRGVGGSITGGADADTFVIRGSLGRVDGMVDGAGGTNTLDYSGSLSVDVTLTGLGGTTGFAGTASRTGGFDDITNLVGRSISSVFRDSLQGLDADATFTLAATNSYQSGGNTLIFSNIEDLQGGSMADTFEVSAAHSGTLRGGAGADIFNIGALLTGNIFGEGGANTYNMLSGGGVTGTISGVGGLTNTLDYSGMTTQVDVTLSGLGSTMGFAGTSNIVANFDDITSLIGGSATDDTLRGRDADATFTLDAVNTYESVNTLRFSNIENLVGGSMADTFTVVRRLTGNIEGGAGDNIYNLNFGGSVLGSIGITGGAGDEIFNINGRYILDLFGLGGADTFNVNRALTGNIEGGAGDNTYNLNVDFVDGTITGGADADTFVFSDNMLFSVTSMDIVGAGGTNTLDYGGFSFPASVDITLTGPGGTTGFAGAAITSVFEVFHGLTIFDDITDVVGGTAMTDTLQGLDAAATFTLAATNSYASGGNTLIFSNIENLQGGSMADTFEVSAAHSGNLRGGDGADIFTVSAPLSGNLLGGDGADIFTVSALLSGNIFGEGGANTYNMLSGGGVTGTISGVGGLTNTLDYSAMTTQVDVTLNALGGTEGFAGTSNITGAFDNITSLIGGSDLGDSLTGLDAVGTFTLEDVVDTYESGGRTLRFNNIENLVGGNMADTFTVNTAHSGTLQGEGGADTFNVNASLGGNIEGGAGNNIYNLESGGSVSGGITAGGGDEMFNINGAFTADLNGQGGADTFTVNAVLTGLIEGGAGDDTFILGDSGSASGGLDGGADSDTFQGRNVDSTFNVAGAASTYQTTGGGFMQAFSNIENLRGGSAADTFTVSAAHSGNLQGGGGADRFTLTDALTGNIEGGAGANIYNLNSGGSVSAGITAGADGEEFNINAAYTLDLEGLGGADTFNVGMGGALTGTIIGGDGANIYNFNGGSVVGLTAGGAAVTETFNINADTTLSSLDGGAGTDIFNIGATLTGSISGGVGSNTYNLDSGGSVNGTITGGANADNFVFNGGSVTGVVGGAGGTNTLDYNTRTAQVGVTLTGLGSTVGFDGTATGTGGFNDITNLVGGSATSDSLTGQNQMAAFTVNTANGGTYESTNVLGFSNIESLTGGAMADTFTVDAALAGSITGGNGANVYNLNTGSVAGGITAGVGDEMFNINGDFTADLNGQGGADTFTVDAVLTGLIEGGAGDDTFILGDSGSASGGLDGGLDSDTFQGRNVASTFNVAGAASTYEATGGFSQTFSNIENLRGGSAADTFTVSAAHSGNLQGGDGADVFTLTAALTGTIEGGAGANIYNLNSGGSVSAGITAGADDEEFNINAAYTLNLDGLGGADTFTLTAALTGDIEGGAGANIYNLNSGGSVTGGITAGAGDETFNINAAYTLDLDGLGGADTFILGASGSANNLDGGADTDTFRGRDAVATFDIDGTNTYEISGSMSQAFTNIENLQGGNMIDTFEVNAAHTGDLRGGAEADVFNVSALLTGNIFGEAGADLYNMLGGGGVTGTISGTSSGGMDTLDFSGMTAQVDVTLTSLGGVGGFAGTSNVAGVVGTFDNIINLIGGSNLGDSLTGLDAVGTFTVNAADGGTYESTNMLSFSGIENLIGGTLADTFTINSGGSLSGMLDGMAGMDTLDGSLIDAVTLTGSGTDGFAGDETDISGGFDGIDTLTGTGVGTTLTGRGVDSTWLLDDSPTYNDGSQTLNFGGFATLQGGMMADTFTVSTDSAFNLAGGNGADIFTINAALTGSVDGMAGIDTLDGSQIDAVTLTGSNTNGFAGTEPDIIIISGGFDGIDTLTGTGGGTTTLTGRGVDSTWTLGGSPTYNDGSQTLSFGGFATLQGGALVDTFTVSAASTFNLAGGEEADIFTIDAVLTGSVDGMAGIDTLDGSLIDAVTLTGSSGTGFAGDEMGIIGGFDGIDTLTGNGGGTLTGQNEDSTWTLGGSPTYNDGTVGQDLSFGGFATLQGGTMADTFTVSTDSAFTLLGGDGADGFSIDAVLTGSVNGEAGSDTVTLGDSGSVSGTLDGGTGIDTLAGPNQGNTWEITGIDSGTVNSQAFSSFNILQGGMMADTFTVSTASAFTLLGGDGADGFTIDAALTGRVNGEAGMDTLDGSQIDVVTLTGSDADGFAGDELGISMGFDGIDTLTGNGGGTLTGWNADSAWTLGGSPTYNDGSQTLSFGGFATLQGGTMADTFTVSTDSAFTLLGGDGADGFSIDAVLTGSVNGEAGSDTVTLGDSGSVSGTLDGGTGIDTLAGPNQGNTWEITGIDSGTVNSQAFSSFNILQGGMMADTFTVSTASAFTLLGGDGADGFTIDAALTGRVNGEAGMDTLDGSQIDVVTLTGSNTNGFAGDELGISMGFDGIDTLTGNGGGTLTGWNADSAWTLGGSPTYNDGSQTLSFGGFATLQGGTMADTFTVSTASAFTLLGGGGADGFIIDAALTGRVDGMAGIDTLDGSQIDAVTLTSSDADGFAGDELGISMGFDGIDTLTGAGGGTLTGWNADSAWLLDDSPTYNDGSQTLNFGGFATLQGGTMADTFTVSTDSAFTLLGGDGADGFSIDAVLTGSVNGEAGSDTVTLGDSGSVSGTLDGGTGIDTLAGPNQGNTWEITGIDSGTVNSQAFSSFNILQGGMMADTFTVSTASAFTLLGGDGADGFTIDAALTGRVDGMAGIDTLDGSLIDAVTLTGSNTNGFAGDELGISMGFDGIDTLTGNGGGTLTGWNADSAWTLGGSPTYNDGSQTLNFGGFATLQGGTMADTFTVSTDSAFTLLGGDGADGFSIDAVLTGSVNGEAGSDTVTLGDSGSVSGTLDGGTGIDTLAGPNQGNTWEITGIDSGTVNSQAFSSFNILQGGMMADTFTVSTASAFTLLGGDGADGFTIDAALTGRVDGMAGIDTLDGSLIDAVTLTGSNTNGFAGDELGISMGFDGIDTLTGAGGGTLTGWNADSAWTLGGSPTYNDGSQTLSFGGFATLQGGALVDTFTVSTASAFTLLGGDGADGFTIDAALTGRVDGMAGIDTLDGSQIDAVTLTGSSDTGFAGDEMGISGGFDGIDTLTGNGGGTLTGWNADSAWLLDDSPTYNDGSQTLSFGGFATLQGGALVDTFTVSAASAFNLAGGEEADIFTINAALTGSVDGEADMDTLDGSLIDAVTLTSSDTEGFAGTEPDIISGGFDGIDTLTGSGGTLTGRGDIASTWTLDGSPTYNDGSRDLSFSGFATLQGGMMADTFTVSTASAFTLLGGDGADDFTIDAALTGRVDGMAGIDTLDGSLIDAVTLTGSNTNGFAGTETDITDISGGFDGIDTLTGTGVGTTLLTGRGVDSTWLLDDSPTYNDGSQTLSFGGFATLQGGMMADTFTVSTDSAFTLLGGGGADGFTIDAALTGSVDGEAGMDTLDGSQIDVVTLTGSDADGFAGDELGISMGFDGIDTLTGTGGGTTLTGRGVDSTWTLGGSPTYNDGSQTLSFGGFATLQGGAMADTFTVSTASAFTLLGGGGADGFTIDAALTGSVDGEAGMDTLDGSQIDVVTLTGSDADGFAGDELGISMGFDGIDTLTGTGGGTTTLTGRGVDSTWTLGGSPTYNDGSQTLSFGGFATLQGGTMADTFTVSTASAFTLLGGGGADGFTIDAALTGSVDGEAGMDTLDGSQIDAVTLTSSDADGFAGDELGISMGFDGIDTLTGTGGGTTTLTGRGVDSTWTLGGSPTYNDGSQTLSFGGFATLQGGAMADTFTVSTASAFTLLGGGGADGFSIDAALTGSVDGMAGMDTLDGSQIDVVTLTGSDADGFAGDELGISMGFDGIDTLTGTGGGTTTLTGRGVDSTWTLGGSPTYNDGSQTLSFGGFATLQGGAMADTFTVSTASAFNLMGGGGADGFTIDAALTGSVDGEAGMDTLDGSQIDVVTLTGSDADGFAGDELGISMGFDGIDTLTGTGGGTTTLTGRGVDSTWTLGGSPTYNDGSQTLSFGGFATLQGGTMADTFTVSTASAFTLLGGGGADGFTIDAALTGSVDGMAGMDTLDGSQIDVVTLTGSDADGFAGDELGISMGFDGIDTLTGTGGGTTTLTGRGVDSTWTLDGSPTYNDGSQTLNFGGFATLQGGTMADTFTVSTASAFTLLGGGGADGFTIDAALTGSVDGMAGMDTLDGSQIDVVTLTGSDADGFAGDELGISMGFDGIDTLTGTGGGTTTLTGRGVDSTWLLDGSPTYNDGSQTLNFGGFATLQGGTMADTFTVSTASAFNLMGGDGADIFTINAALTGSVDGMTGMDTLDGSLIDVVTLTGLGTEGFAGTETDISEGFDGIDTLTGNGGTLTGRGVDSTWLLDGSPTYNDGSQTLNFGGFATLQGGALVDTFTVSAASIFNLAGGTGNDIFTLTAALTGGIAGGEGDNVFNLSGGGGGVINGIVTLATASNNYWYHTAGQSLTTDAGSVTGTGSLFIPDIDRGGSEGTRDLTIGTGTGDLILPDLTDFTGHLVIGGIISPLTAPTSPYYVNPGPDPAAPLPTIPTILVNTETLTVAIPSPGTAPTPAINTGGPVTLLARNINLNNDITAGGMIGLVAAATATGEGLITLGGGEVTLTAPASTTRPSGAFIASNFVNPINLVLAFSGGEVDIAVGSGVNIQVSGSSDNAASTDDDDFVRFRDAISTGRTEANVPVRICTSGTACSFSPGEVPVIPVISLPDDVVPIFAQLFALAIVTQTSLIAELIGLKTVASIDIGLFEEDLTLYGQIGTGIALALAQCEEQEGCAPNVTEEELDILISGLEEKVAQLEGLLDEELDDDERPRIEQLLLDYNMLLGDFRQYRESLREFFAVEDEVEEEEIQSLEEELAPVPVQPGVVKKLTGILENIKSRLEWLEGLKSDPEALERLGERSNIDLTPEVLDAIIESTRSEAQFIEDSIRRFIEGVPGAGRIGNDRSILLIDRRDMRDIQRQYAQQVPISVSKALQN